MSDDAAREQTHLFERADAALQSVVRIDESPARRADLSIRFWVPGRVEFLGKHTDYAGGRSLLCAIERGICLVARPRLDARLRFVDADRPTDVVDTTIQSSLTWAAGHWSTYPLAVARRIARDFGEPLTGADIVLCSDLPQAAGMSSSSALVVATFLALAAVNRLNERAEYTRELPTPERLAEYLGAVENGYAFGGFSSDAGVGTFGGSEDHTAILCARPNALVQYSFCPVRLERMLPLPADHELVIASSGIVAEKIGAARDRYNDLSQSARRIAARWREMASREQATLGDACAALSSEDMEVLIRAGAADTDRLAQFVLESTELIPQAGDALGAGDLKQLGALVDRSQDAAERCLRNQIPETIWLQRDARLRGAAAASAFGAGFGGSVWALVRADHAREFCDAWSRRYAEHFPSAATNAKFFRTRAGPPAAQL